MIEWASVNTRNINRIGYNKEVHSLFIDFIGSTTDTVFVKVPEPLFDSFKSARSPDNFYNKFVEGYFEIAHFSK